MFKKHLVFLMIISLGILLSGCFHEEAKKGETTSWPVKLLTLDTAAGIKQAKIVPASEILLTITTAQGSSVQVTTDEEGKAIVNLPVGTHTYSVAKCNFPSQVGAIDPNIRTFTVQKDGTHEHHANGYMQIPLECPSQTLTKVVPTPKVEEVSQTTTLLNDLETVTKIDFTNIEKSQFEWIINDDGDRVTLDGEKITVRTQLAGSEVIDKYFTDNGYTLDFNNLADGTVSSRAAFKKDKSVCTVLVQGEYEEFTMPDESTMASVEINCGILETE